MAFSDILRDLMIDNNLNQTELAQIMHIKASQISEWLSGKCTPGYDNLKKLAYALNTSADTLLGIK